MQHDRPKTVLVVDDLVEITDIFREIFHKIQGPMHVTFENDAERAFARVDSRPYDLVLTDFRMPEIDGLRLLEAAYATNREGYRVLMTGYRELPTSGERVRSAHLDGFLQKPFHMQEAVLLITTLFDGPPSTRDILRRTAYETASRLAHAGEQHGEQHAA